MLSAEFLEIDAWRRGIATNYCPSRGALYVAHRLARREHREHCESNMIILKR